MTKYLFGDTNLAARRLHYLAEVFRPSMEAFILSVLDQPPQLLFDLGCGPGFSTHLLAEFTQSDQVIGLDKSTYFISLAQQGQTNRLKFYTHDLTTVPFPEKPGEVAYCRFLLTHIKNPIAIIERWASQLRPGGLLLLDEAEWIKTSNQTFTTYLDHVVAMLADQGNELYVGPRLNQLEQVGRLKKQSSRVQCLTVPNHQAAGMFYMNIQTWKEHPFIQATVDQAILDELERELHNLASQTASTSEIEWGLRQLVFKSVESKEG